MGEQTPLTDEELRQLSDAINTAAEQILSAALEGVTLNQDETRAKIAAVRRAVAAHADAWRAHYRRIYGLSLFVPTTDEAPKALDRVKGPGVE